MSLRHLIQLLSLVLALLALGGCARNAVTMATYSTHGFDYDGRNPSNQRIVIGFDRFEGVVMPAMDDDGQVKKEAYPTFASIHVDTRLATGSRIRTVFATGKAATKAAGSGEFVRAAVQATQREPFAIPAYAASINTDIQARLIRRRLDEILRPEPNQPRAAPNEEGVKLAERLRDEFPPRLYAGLTFAEVWQFYDLAGRIARDPNIAEREENQRRFLAILEQVTK